ncbi:MAG TPA: MogA/MoaB family molybdenum cofactor biosynthesis protein [Solirubrobacteraceae bacterium]|nr:MogA/MoaB family molybdenum cofactor biosynthesis protein [Solirubrobacteraceae bacterium]
MDERAAILTISSSKAVRAGEAGGPEQSGDESGPRLAALVKRLKLTLAGRELIPDDRALIEDRLRHWADSERCALILTSGGTGLSPTDLTPEATRGVLEREAPGIGEAIRDASRPHTPNWMLSRAVAGTRGATLIVNFPGSPASIEQTGQELAGPLAHALALIAGRPVGH